ncbi:snakin-2-like [Hibiscus syriacus]|uniref:snakin-2-like n=1 Tax=Hibiscus syriacus TaxID=106335 RepID=UPI00192180B9|nr:snakin-2-like [Hibiscus syriacus]XP_039058217.1 snakin-2-like [Hibiscus syriacus]
MEFRLTLLLLLLFLCMVQVPSETTIEERNLTQMVKGPTRKLFHFVDCGGLCQARYILHSRQNVCKRACGTCCARCKCVPPGTSGNRERCGRCYTDMRTHGNKFKCP